MLLFDGQIQNRKGTIGHYDMRDMLVNSTVIRDNAVKLVAPSAPSSSSTRAVEQEKVAGALMSANIDELIQEANLQPLNSKGMYNMYWQSGRLYSEARDVFRAAHMGENETMRIFKFSDCGEKPKERRFQVQVVCSQNGRQIPRCCSTEACQTKYMSQVYPAALGVSNF